MPLPIDHCAANKVEYNHFNLQLDKLQKEMFKPEDEGSLWQHQYVAQANKLKNKQVKSYGYKIEN